MTSSFYEQRDDLYDKIDELRFELQNTQFQINGCLAKEDQLNDDILNANTPMSIINAQSSLIESINKRTQLSIQANDLKHEINDYTKQYKDIDNKIQCNEIMDAIFATSWNY